MSQPQALSVVTANAVAGMSFCSVWPMAQGILNGVLPSVSNAALRTAIVALIAAANAVCSSSSSSAARLAGFNLVAPAGQEDFLAGLSDNELQVLANVQRQASQTGHNVAADVGTYFF